MVLLRAELVSKLSPFEPMKPINKAATEKAASQLMILLKKAESTQKIVEAARSQWRMIKLEHRQARKAFKQAKKAARCARKEAKAAARNLKEKGFKLPKPLKPATISKFLAHQGGKRPVRHQALGKRNGHATVTMPTEPAPMPVELQA